MGSFAPAFDIAAAGQTLRRNGRVHIPHALTEADASALLADMPDARWMTATIDQSGGVFRLDAAMATALDPGQRTRILEGVYTDAGEGFQYLYDKFSIDAVYAAGRPLPANMKAFYEALNSPSWLDAFRAVTGDERIASVDCQASRYRVGHLLTEHNDENPSNTRLYAYVLNLSRAWRIEWGGLLQFHDEDDHVSCAFTPRWNTLNMFAVPQRHSVSMVTPAAKADRLSLTGWLHKRAEP
jgi:hypothetical protein